MDTADGILAVPATVELIVAAPVLVTVGTDPVFVALD